MTPMVKLKDKYGRTTGQKKGTVVCLGPSTKMMPHITSGCSVKSFASLSKWNWKYISFGTIPPMVKLKDKYRRSPV
jgi:hypothetical protein